MSVKTPTSTVQNNFVPSSRADNYSVVPPPIPCRTYKPYGSFNNNQSYSTNHRQYLSVPLHHSDLSVLDPSVLAWQHNQPYSPPPMKTNDSVAQNDLAYYLALDARYRKRSQDDDDCSTTTSGSYTLHSVEDLLWLDKNFVTNDLIGWSCKSSSNRQFDWLINSIQLKV